MSLFTFTARAARAQNPRLLFFLSSLSRASQHRFSAAAGKNSVVSKFPSVRVRKTKSEREKPGERGRKSEEEVHIRRGRSNFSKYVAAEGNEMVSRF